MEKDYKKMYEDALKRTMNLALTNNISALAASEIFPELKESEDEKIRKDLKFYLEVRRCQTNDDKEYISCNKFLSWLENQGKQKGDWSEEDEEVLNNIITAFKRIGENCEHYFSPDTAKVFEKTLKSLKDKIQPHQEWNEEDEKMLTLIINEIEAIKSNSSTIFEKNIAQEKIDWLKSIKPQQNQYDKCYKDGYSASEHNLKITEEDIVHIDNIIGCLEEFTNPGFPIYKGNVFKEIKWLENLKNNK